MALGTGEAVDVGTQLTPSIGDKQGRSNATCLQDTRHPVLCQIPRRVQIFQDPVERESENSKSVILNQIVPLMNNHLDFGVTSIVAHFVIVYAVNIQRTTLEIVKEVCNWRSCIPAVDEILLCAL
jgi:hypothetical protein